MIDVEKLKVGIDSLEEKNKKFLFIPINILFISDKTSMASLSKKKKLKIILPFFAK